MTRRLGDWCRNRNKLPDLARSLNNLSIRLGDIGQSKKDLAAKEVFTIRRKLIKIQTFGTPGRTRAISGPHNPTELFKQREPSAESPGRPKVGEAKISANLSTP